MSRPKVMKVCSVSRFRLIFFLASGAEGAAGVRSAALAPFPLDFCTLVKKLKSSSFFFLKALRPEQLEQLDQEENRDRFDELISQDQ